MPPMPNVKAKHWGKVDKKHLANLIREGDINISNSSYANIKDIRLAYFPITMSGISIALFETSQPYLTLRPNTMVRGNAKQVSRNILQYFYFIFMCIVCHIFPSGEEKEDKAHHNAKDAAAAAAATNDNDDNRQQQYNHAPQGEAHGSNGCKKSKEG
jgi:hypothetical protein